jgi:chemotaxis response regulator CheB
LPAGFGASLIVLVHLPPERSSRLTEVLARSSSLPVVAAEHGLPRLPG